MKTRGYYLHLHRTFDGAPALCDGLGMVVVDDGGGKDEVGRNSILGNEPSVGASRPWGRRCLGIRIH